MRWVVLEKLEEVLNSSDVSAETIAILGGTSKDPEVELIKKQFPHSKITYLGIENDSNDTPFLYLDLNKSIDFKETFDLVVCSQVLEHIWNFDVAVNLIRELVPVSGRIWINCPTSNMAHGSPDYFSAGYTPSYLDKNFEKLGFQTLNSGCYGSERYYKATHLLRLWSTRKEHDHPISGYRISGKITLGKIKEMLFRIPGRLTMTIWNKDVREDIDFATETYYFGIKAMK
jgi:SAM-dependent methyltransferase